VPPVCIPFADAFQRLLTTHGKPGLCVVCLRAISAFSRYSTQHLLHYGSPFGFHFCFRSVPSGFVQRTGCSACGLQQPREQGGPLKEMHPIAPRRRPNSPCFMHLYRRVLTRSRSPEFPKANQLLAHLALLVGPEALSRPATAQKSPPGAAARHLGWAVPSPKPRRAF
jgi:hypothetical protein